MDTSDHDVPSVYTGYINDIYDQIYQECTSDIQDTNVPEVLDSFEWDEEIIYIVHIHIHPVVSVDVFERNESGTPLKFLDENDDPKDFVSVDEVWDPSSYVLPALYGIDKKNKERMWKVWVIGPTVYKSYGETKGGKTPSTRTFKGVNKDRKNKTTAEEQAKREAERDWVKQLDKDYHPKTEDGLALEKKVLAAKKKQGGVNVNIDEILRGREKEVDLDDNEDSITIEPDVDDEKQLLPMHCNLWSTDQKCLKYFDFENGVYIQPKLNGVRCLAKIKNGNVIFTTRSGKSMVWLDHLREQVKIFLADDIDIQLDCEVYAHKILGVATYNGKKYSYTDDTSDLEEGVSPSELDMEQCFDVISGAARPIRGDPHPLETQLCLYVFDIADPTGELDQDERFEILKRLFSSKIKLRECPNIKRVDTKVIYYQEEVTDYHDEVSEHGYEGVILRARDLLYESHRKSLRMRKYKYFIDEEYPIVDIKCDSGVGREQFVWVCEKIIESPETGENILTTFDVKPMGTREQRWNWYDNSDDYLGKLLNVRYQQLTYRGVPNFPRGTHIRDYDDEL
jgi:hypothetical protein